MSICRATGVPLSAFLVLSAALAGAQPAAAQTYKVLYPFRASVRITSSLVEVAPGEFYGTTDRGGAWSQGSVVKVTAGAVTTLHSFDSSVDGDGPVAGLMYDGAGFLYGTTTNAGPNGRGTVFRIKPDGTSFETVYEFLGGSEPFSPEAALIKGSDGKLYGTSRLGGANGLGTVFSLDVSTTPATLTTLYSFSGGAMDGASPVASLLESGGYLYGTTFGGGNSPDLGTVFKISTSGSMQWVTPFPAGGLGGANPKGGVVETGGVFYGTTEAGGFVGAGTVFTVTDAGVLTKAYEFNAKGTVPRAGLTLGADGLLYGTTNNGGANFRGTVFRIDPSATPLVEQTLHSFSDGNTNGRYPTTGVVMGSDLKIYGTTPEGGPGNYGVAYWVDPTLPAFGIFYADAGDEGAGPFSPLFRDGGGALYGTASVGGKASNGSIYRIDPCATPPCPMTTLRATADLGMGQDSSGVVPGGGFLYGTTKDSNGLYRIDMLDGSGFQKLYTFTGSPGNFPNGSFPVGVTERGGLLYGATASGGAQDKGTVFSLDPASPSSLAWSTSFTRSGSVYPNGDYPSSQLVAGSDGKLYGVTTGGSLETSPPPVFSKGTLFRVTTGGVLEPLHKFSGPEGANPWAALTPAGPGIFYGTTTAGGAYGKGTFFRLDATTTPAGLTTLRDFAAGEVEGVSVLTLGSDGNFYGTSYGWGANGRGSVIRLTPGGALQILHSFSGSDGAYPRGGVLRLADGTLLGTAEMAGPKDGGVVFSLKPAGTATATVSGGGLICGAGESLIQAVLTGTPPWSLTWSDGAVQTGVTTSLVTRTVAPAVTTVYTLTSFSDAGGPGIASGSATVTVGSLASPVIAAPSIVGEDSPNRTASVAAHAGSTYAWSVTNGTITGGQGSSQITFRSGTQGTLTLSVVESNGACSSAPATANVTVAAPGQALLFYPLYPCRLYSTPGGSGPPLAGGEVRTIVPSACGIPASAKAIAANATVVKPLASGHLVLWPGPATNPMPATSNLNFNAGRTRSNNVIVTMPRTAASGFNIYNGSYLTTPLIIDVSGYFE